MQTQGALLLKQKIFDFVKINGPVLPTNTAKAVNENTMLVSAFLSELVADKLIKISNAKIGTSPVYYIKGQEEKLQILYQHLPAKEKELYNLLKEEGVMLDKITEPAYRVALRSLKDFAVPLQVKFESTEELFWKWYLLSDEELNKKIEFILNLQEQVEIKEQAEVQGLVTGNQIEDQKAEEDTFKVAGSIIQTKLQGTKKTIQESSEKQIKEQVKEKLTKDRKIAKNKIARQKIIKPNEFESFINATLSSLEVTITNKTIQNKREIDFVIVVPSKIGNLKYLVKAKNKKKINEADCSLAYSAGERTKLPVLFISNGELTKRAKDYIEKLGGYLVFKKID